MRAIYFFSKGEKHEKWVLHTAQSKPKSHTFKTYLGFTEIPNIDAEHHNKKDLVKRYGPYLLDIDANKEKGKTFDEAISDTQKVVQKLLSLGVSEEHFQIFFSGKKGFHVLIAAEVLGSEDGDPYLALIHKKLDSELFPLSEFPNLDRSIRSMGMGRMIRIPNSKRSDNKKHKIQIKISELNSFKEEDYLQLASEPRNCWGSSTEIKKNEHLAGLYTRFKEEVLQEQKNKGVSTYNSDIKLENIPPCLEKILESNTKLQDDISFNQLCFSCLIPTLKISGVNSPNDALSDEKVSHFLDNFEDSSAYTSSIQRTDHFSQCWSDDENTHREFSCGAMILASGNDVSVCSDCPMREINVLAELSAEYGEVVTFEQLVEQQKDSETHKRSNNPFIDDMNRVYTLSAIGSKEVIIQRMVDGGIRLLGVKAFETFLENNRVSTVTASGKPTQINGGRYWLQHKDRDTKDSIVFKPQGTSNENEYNLWQGYSVNKVDMTLEQAYEGCKLYLSHVKNVVCGGNENIYDFVMTWLAHLIQKPWEKPGTCIVMKGGEGTGKGTFVRPIIDMIGWKHSISITHKSHFFSHFNSLLENKVLVFLDEAVRASNKAEEGALKAFISESKVSVERKGYEAYHVDNYARVIMASNEEWVVPAGKDARRFLVLDVNNENQQDVTGYFKKLYAELESTCPQCLFKILSEWEIKRDVRETIVTDGLLQQIEYGRDDLDKFLGEIIDSECMPQEVIDSGLKMNEAGSYSDIEYGSGEWPSAINFAVLYGSYLQWRDDNKLTRGTKNRDIFSRAILKMLETDSKERIAKKKDKKMFYYYPIPDFVKFKEKFLNHLKFFKD